MRQRARSEAGFGARSCASPTRVTAHRNLPTTLGKAAVAPPGVWVPSAPRPSAEVSDSTSWPQAPGAHWRKGSDALGARRGPYPPQDAMRSADGLTSRRNAWREQSPSSRHARALSAGNRRRPSQPLGARRWEGPRCDVSGKGKPAGLSTGGPPRHLGALPDTGYVPPGETVHRERKGPAPSKPGPSGVMQITVYI
jgi:hypothetical protein